jgi:hypothetical protein
VAGDWNNDGQADIGIFRNGTWFLDGDGSHIYVYDPRERRDWAPISHGGPGDVPVTGDWNNDGRTDIGIYRNGIWYLGTLSSTGGYLPFATLSHGGPGDVPVTGDWNNDGRADIGIYRNGIWYLGTLSSTRVYQPFAAVIHGGLAGDVPVTGDWDGDGRTDIGIFRGGTWFLGAIRTGAYQPLGQARHGSPGDRPVTGDWLPERIGDDRGITNIGIFRVRYDPQRGWEGIWYLDTNGNYVYFPADLRPPPGVSSTGVLTQPVAP